MNSNKTSPNQKAENDNEKLIAVHGFQQIVDMLKVADPAFRESLLKRLALKDKNLAHSLRRDLESRS